jgi:peptidoglycan/xylan/chitin deacetylase (PgdA/CDA1 family)
VRVNDRPHLVVPYSLTANDSKFGSGGFFTGEDYFTFVKDGFDVLYREGKTQPKMMSLGLHLRLIGHPSRAAGLERVLDYIGSHKDVWVTRRIDIAKHWIEKHPAPRG